MKTNSLYIQTSIKTDMDTLWEKTQDPSLHQQWDLRFSTITYLPKQHKDDPQNFLYTTKLGFGLKIDGIGESVTQKLNSENQRKSVLKFSSESPLSLIKQGSGYWEYVPEGKNINFCTLYDYQTRWRIPGKLIDSLIFRPLINWATAWSFDCLKNWIEKEISPKQALLSQLIVLFISIVLSVVWIYQGLVPKLLYPNSGELDILRQSGMFSGKEKLIITIIGYAEIFFGLLILFIHTKSIHLINISLMLVLGAGALFSQPSTFLQPFNPFTLNLLVITLSIVILTQLSNLPKASNCIFKGI